MPVSSCRVAEATKLLENIFRSVNIALVNELKLVYAAMGIDIWEVIEAAKTKPFGFMPFYPGPGLGGHCIPIDPFYLTWKAREFGKHTRFIELAGEINTGMPEHVVHRVADALNAQSKAIKGSRVLILGLAYKPDVDDERESPSYVLMKLLTERGAEVAYYDPYVPVIKPTREHSQFAGRKSIEWNRADDSGVRPCAYRDEPFIRKLSRAWRVGAMHSGYSKRHGWCTTCPRENLESIVKRTADFAEYAPTARRYTPAYILLPAAATLGPTPKPTATAKAASSLESKAKPTHPQTPTPTPTSALRLTVTRTAAIVLNSIECLVASAISLGSLEVGALRNRIDAF